MAHTPGIFEQAGRIAGGACASHRALAVVSALLVVLIVVLSSFVCEPARAVSGFWVGDAAFLTEAGLSSLFLSITDVRGKPFSPGKYRMSGYLFMTTPQGIICNQPVEMHARLGCGLYRRSLYEGDIVFEPTDDDEFPLTTSGNRARIALSPSSGSLAIKENGELRAFMFKDMAASAAVNVAVEECDTYEEYEEDYDDEEEY